MLLNTTCALVSMADNGIAAEDEGLLMTAALTRSDFGLKQERRYQSLAGQEQVDADSRQEGVCLKQERHYQLLAGEEQLDADSR